MIADAKKTNKIKKSKKLTASRSKKGTTSKEIAARKASKKASKRKATKRQFRKTTAAKKSAWKLSPQYKNSVRDIWVFQKDGVTIGFSQTFRWSSLIVDQRPDLTRYDPEKGISIDNFEYRNLEPGDSSDPNWIFPDDFPIEGQERIKSLWDEEYDEGMRKAGWKCDIETSYFGPLLVEEVEPEYPHNPV
jgi:hypothetical protein